MCREWWDVILCKAKTYSKNNPATVIIIMSLTLDSDILTGF